MQSAVRVPFVFLCFLVAGIQGQDVQPEFPEDFPRPTTQEVITEAPLTTSTTEVPTTILPTEEPTTIPTETPTVPPTETPTVPPTEAPTVPPTETPTIPPTETSTVPPTETPTIPPTETPTVPPTETPTVLPTETPTSTSITTTTEPTTTSTTEPITSSPTTTQKEPPFTPLYVRPTSTRRPTYPAQDPWNWNEPAERCYLKEHHQYITTCWGFGWTSAFTCYRCCYYGHSNFAGCSKLHQGRCWWFD